MSEETLEPKLPDKFVGLFVGPRKIATAVISEALTYLGRAKVDMVYDDGKKETLPFEALESIVTKEVSDFTELQAKRIAPVLEKLLVILVESEMTRDDIDKTIGSALPDSIGGSYRRAVERMWGKELHDVTLLDVEKALKPEKQP